MENEELQRYLDNLQAAKQQEMGLQMMTDSLAASAQTRPGSVAGLYSGGPQAELENYFAQKEDARKMDIVNANKANPKPKQYDATDLMDVATGQDVSFDPEAGSYGYMKDGAWTPSSSTRKKEPKQTGKGKADNDGKGKNLLDSAVTKISNDQVALESIDSTFDLLGSLNANPLLKKFYAYSMGEWGAVGVPEEYQQASARMAPYVAQIRNSIYGASLTKDEKAAALLLLPDPQDTPEYARNKLKELRSFINSRREAFITTQKAAGRDVSKVPKVRTSSEAEKTEKPKEAKPEKAPRYDEWEE